jgi:two-component system sensor histidine kinase YesM
VIPQSLVWLHRRLRIATKLFIMAFVLMVALILLLNVFFQRRAAETLLFAQTEFAKQLIEKSDEYLQLNLRNMKSFFLSVANDPRLQTGNYEQIQAWLNDNLILYIPNAKNIHLFKDNEIVASTTPINWLLEDDATFIANLNVGKLPYEIYWTKPYSSPVSGYTITAMMRIPSGTGSFHTLALDLDFAGFYESILPSTVSSLNGDLLLLDRQNDPIFGTEPYMSYNVSTRKYEHKLLDADLFDRTWLTLELKRGQLDLLLVRKPNNLVGWQEIWIMDRKELLKPLQQGLSSSWLVVLYSSLLALLLAYVISVLIGGPIRKIAESMNEVSQGQWNTTIRLERYDELGLLAKHFNSMTKKISELIADLTRKESEKKESDFRALQSQIRPHFMYNTLNSIGAASRKGQFDKVDALISSFSETLQYCLDMSPAPLTFKEEMNAVQYYIQLMQIRYDTRFSVEMDIDPHTRSLVLPKFTLQPLIENSIFHGIVPDLKSGVLFIGTALNGDSWDIMVEDSGIGMAPEKLLDVLQSLDRQRHTEFEHIGLYSVHNRLKLMFGEAYSFQMTSSSESGTRIILTLPVQRAKEKEDPDDTDRVAG